MSYAIHPYAISIAGIKKRLGSRDRRLVKSLIGKNRDEFEEIDELDDEAPPVERALSQLVMGEEPNPDYGYVYGYALKFLCENDGDMLSNRHASSVGWEWIEEVDAALAAAGVNARVFRLDPHLTTRGAPVPLPSIDDFPSIGYLLEAEIAQVVMALAAIKEAAIDDEDIRDSIAEIRNWLDHCARVHNDLVCFYH